jgi:hypothetical protein
MKMKTLILESYEAICDCPSAEELKAQFNEYLNSVNQPVNVNGCEFTAAEALEKMFPFNYEESFKKWKTENGYDDCECEDEKCSCTCADGECKCTCEPGECTCKNSDEVIQEEFEEIEPLLSSFDTEVSLGISDGIYYIKIGKDGVWNEIPADTYEEAETYYENKVKVRQAEQKPENEFEDEIAQECNRIWESRQHAKNKHLIH